MPVSWIVLLAAGAVLAGCSSGAAGPSASMRGAASAAASGGASATRHVTAGPLSLELPAGWHSRPGSLNPSGNVAFLFAAPVDLPSDCEETAQGGTCHPWPVMQLGTDGSIVAVRLHGLPGTTPPAGGSSVTVAGLAAREITGPADTAYRAIGGTELIEVILPTIQGASGYLSIDGCLAGSDTAAVGTFASIIAGVMIGA